ncbi:hypothetical protein E2C01_061585 [Portunus trituberculatus]|uniref:Uncharacterized protein n=1 Tax=Portunus trituberculatus TaxID=210409 RepID=A0A5B7H5M3_PORTR|nr:hypothetical protein [Portunus trituberculatus]
MYLRRVVSRAGGEGTSRSVTSLSDYFDSNQKDEWEVQAGTLLISFLEIEFLRRGEEQEEGQTAEENIAHG